MPADDSPVTPLKRQLAERIAAHVRRSGQTQVQAADELELTQPRLNALLQGHVELFSLDALVEIAGRMELTVRISVARPYNRG
jgi:predicted XRE-type DNA-binding protein